MQDPLGEVESKCIPSLYMQKFSYRVQTTCTTTIQILVTYFELRPHDMDVINYAVGKITNLNPTLHVRKKQ